MSSLMSSRMMRPMRRCATSPSADRTRLSRPFRNAQVDDEPVTNADEQALAEVQADRDAGVGRISFAEIKRLHGQA
jgi:hypothetical protein